jgi:hypothetical protein
MTCPIYKIWSILIFAILSTSTGLMALDKIQTALVLLDDTSLEKLGTFPISRSVYARCLNILNEQYHAKTICFDFCIDLPSEIDSKGDLQLFDTVASMKHLVLNMMIGKQDKEFQLNALQKSKAWPSFPSPFNYKSALIPMDSLLKEGVSIGVHGTYDNKLLNIADNYETSVFPVSFIVDGCNYPTLAVAGAFDYLDFPPKDIELFDRSPYFPVDVSLEIPVYELSTVLEGQVKQDALEGKVVVFGAGATGFGQDLYTSKGQMKTSLYLAKAIQSLINIVQGE